jgi:hypothetical protein
MLKYYKEKMRVDFQILHTYLILSRKTNFLCGPCKKAKFSAKISFVFFVHSTKNVSFSWNFALFFCKGGIYTRDQESISFFTFYLFANKKLCILVMWASWKDSKILLLCELFHFKYSRFAQSKSHNWYEILPPIGNKCR